MHFCPQLLCEVVFICVWKRRCADVRAGTQAPPLRFRLGGLRVGGLVSFGWIACKWSFYLCGIAWKNITERGRGGACVPARVAPSRAHPSLKSPTHNACIFGMETPLSGRSGGHTGAAPTISFGQIVRGTVGGFEQIARGCSPLRISFGWIVSGRLMLFGWITRGWLVPFGDDCARMYNGDG